MEKIKTLILQYVDQIVVWYDGLEQLYQYGVFFLGIVVVFLFVTYVILHRITR